MTKKTREKKENLISKIAGQRGVVPKITMRKKKKKKGAERETDLLHIHQNQDTNHTINKKSLIKQ